MSTMFKTNEAIQSSDLSGSIDFVTNGAVFGWCIAPYENLKLVLLVNGKPQLHYRKVERPDVNEVFNTTGDWGFEFIVDGIPNNALLQLCVRVGGQLIVITSYTVTHGTVEESFIRQLARASEIASDPNAVAITCWDGGHNAVGRSKVLYDIVTQKYPALIIAYLFKDFGGKVWTPLLSTGCDVLTIPWDNREIYHDAIAKSGLLFNTVWVSKARFPSFQLASLIAKNDTSLLVDFDDNEEYFSLHGASLNTAFGLPTLNLTKKLIENIPSRTAASITLKEKYDATIIRHARRTQNSLSNGELAHDDADEELSLGFIGTVRAHKKLLNAAIAIANYNHFHDKKIQLHVYGDIKPLSFAKELEDNGVRVKQDIPMSSLYSELQQMDIVLTGFTGGEQDEEVNNYQISSKIGDALAVGKPVLVPFSPSVADLENVPGVFVFKECSFISSLEQAINYNEPIELPKEFSIEGALEAFENVKIKAQHSQRADKVFSYLPMMTRKSELREGIRPTLLLVWKQADAGFYGRRIDQIARSYKMANPEHDVVVLELIHEETKKAERSTSKNFSCENHHLLELKNKKKTGFTNGDGVTLYRVEYNNSNLLKNIVEEFLVTHSILPANSVVIFFPIIRFLEKFLSLFENYKTIIDVVDNQMAWAKGKTKDEFAHQFRNLLLFGDVILFNSEVNRQLYLDKGLLNSAVTHEVVPNWYQLPAGVFSSDENTLVEDKSKEINLLYSGNMNDRIDWGLLEQLAHTYPQCTIHLVGTVFSDRYAFYDFLRHPNVVYHGPMSEKDTLHLLKTINLAIMPHTVNHISRYMNPLKIHMYNAAGVHTLSTSVPGIEENQNLTIATTHSEFLSLVPALANKKAVISTQQEPPFFAKRYLDIIKRLRYY